MEVEIRMTLPRNPEGDVKGEVLLGEEEGPEDGVETEETEETIVGTMVTDTETDHVVVDTREVGEGPQTAQAPRVATKDATVAETPETVTATIGTDMMIAIEKTIEDAGGEVTRRSTSAHRTFCDASKI